MEQKQCRVCQNEKASVCPSRAKRANWICSKCNNKRTDEDPARYMARKMSVKKRKVNENAPGTALARMILGKYGAQSMLSGETNLKRLCLVRIDLDQPWTVDNTIIVTSAESYAINIFCKEKRQHLFQLIKGQIK